MKGGEKVILALRGLYESYGYRPYKMGRFEEYDLYAQNKDFLVSSNVITFTDTDGKLMALKPDVTLSIVRSVREGRGLVSRVCYDENVYRVSDRSGTFREIMQAGLECIGDVGPVELSEVVILAQRSLALISDSYMLTISHMGIAEGFLNGISNADAKERALQALGSRNVSALEALADEYRNDAQALRKLSKLCLMAGTSDEIYGQLEELGADAVAVSELRRVMDSLEPNGVRMDFTILDTMKYYNGITFRGYVSGVPVPVVSGGQYDKLMRRMGKGAKAIGFAVYMDSLERLLEDASEYDVDTVLVYGASDDPALVIAKAAELRVSGKSVVAMKEVPCSCRYRRLVMMGGSENA